MRSALSFSLWLAKKLTGFYRVPDVFLDAFILRRIPSSAPSPELDPLRTHSYYLAQHDLLSQVRIINFVYFILPLTAARSATDPFPCCGRPSLSRILPARHRARSVLALEHLDWSLWDLHAHPSRSIVSSSLLTSTFFHQSISRTCFLSHNILVQIHGTKTVYLYPPDTPPSSLYLAPPPHSRPRCSPSRLHASTHRPSCPAGPGSSSRQRGRRRRGQCWSGRGRPS